MTRMNMILLLLAVSAVASGQEPDPFPMCAPPESDLIPMIVVATVMFGGGWLVRMLWDRRKK